MSSSVRSNQGGVTRRRALTIAAGVTGLGLAGGLGAFSQRSPSPETSLHSWRGTALGADTHLLIAGLDEREAQRLVALALAEIERLEKIYSLYRADSALVRLNAEGALSHPPAELVALLERARQWSELSGGAFDVTVQPLWQLYQQHFATAGADPRGPSERALAAASERVDYRALEISSSRIALARPGMAVTLNGIAQGEITDRVADLLRAEGLQHALIDLGEFRALSTHPSGRPWAVGLRDPHDEASLHAKVPLIDRALATSATTGTRFDSQGRHHHLFDPHAGRPSRGLVSASVIARRACDADAFSTALLATPEPVVPQSDMYTSAVNLGVERVVTVDADGIVNDWSAVA